MNIDKLLARCNTLLNGSKYTAQGCHVTTLTHVDVRTSEVIAQSITLSGGDA